MQRRPTTQDISWFLDLNRTKQLELNPPYQRRSVWTNKDRKFFLDTIFKGYPCPAVFLHKRISENGQSVYDVVDGKQRLETILRFTDNKLQVAPEFPDSRYAGKRWRELGEAEKKVFWNYVVPVEQLDFDAGDTSAVEDAFDRLNRNSRKLERQELRHARFDGWFISTVESECQSSFWKDLGLVTSARAKRMKDAQFMAEMLLVIVEGKVAGFDQDHLDSAHAKYDDPDDEGIALDTEKVTQDLESAKSFLATANLVNGCIKAASSTVSAFYTLWSLIVLHRSTLPAAEDFAANYSAFVAFSAKMRDTEESAQAELQIDTQEQRWLPDVHKYNAALSGANTDLTPRQNRLDALLSAMRNP